MELFFYRFYFLNNTIFENTNLQIQGNLPLNISKNISDNFDELYLQFHYFNNIINMFNKQVPERKK